MTCKPEQVRTLMRYANTLPLETAALKAGMSSATAKKYHNAGGRIDKKESSRIYVDAFAEVWKEIETMLQVSPRLQAITLLNWLIKTFPEKQFSTSQLRTLQRRIEDWKHLKGPSREVMFRQQVYPGKQSQSDWTNCNDLGVTIQTQVFMHLLFHFMLPYSRWEAVKLSKSESFDSLTEGFMAAVRRLGAVAHEHRTDNLTAAVNNHENPHEFTPNWQDFLRFYDVQPSKNNAGEGHENGSVEKSHDLFKEALDQALLIRGSRDFSSVGEYEQFIQALVDHRNEQRQHMVNEELKVMKLVPPRAWNAPLIREPRVTKYSLISVDAAVYSVDNRLIGSKLKILIYPEILRVFYRTKLVAELPRQEHGGKLVNWRDVIVPLSRKPGAFRNWQHHDDCFPSLIFRQAYDALKKGNAGTAEREYLSLLRTYSSSTRAQDFEAAMELLLESKQLPQLSAVEELVGPLARANESAPQTANDHDCRKGWLHRLPNRKQQRSKDLKRHRGQSPEALPSPTTGLEPTTILSTTSSPQLVTALSTTGSPQPAATPTTSSPQPVTSLSTTTSRKPATAMSTTSSPQPVAPLVNDKYPKSATELSTTSSGDPITAPSTTTSPKPVTILRTRRMRPATILYPSNTLLKTRVQQRLGRIPPKTNSKNSSYCTQQAVAIP